MTVKIHEMEAGCGMTKILMAHLHVCQEMQAVTKLADLTNFCLTGNIDVNIFSRKILRYVNLG